MKGWLLSLLLVVTASGISQPVITSFAPASAAVGQTVIITGTNFDATTANNIVFFGSVKAVVSASTTTEITTTVPVGAPYELITVLNLSTGLVSYSRTPFLPAFAGGGAGFTTNSFSPTTDLTSTSGGYYFLQQSIIYLSDINGDGKLDIVVLRRNSQIISIFKNTTIGGNISFDPTVDIATLLPLSDISISDIDGDGKADLICANAIPLSLSSVSILRNTGIAGAISFATEVSFINGDINTRTTKIAINDIDGDGKPDIVVGTLFSTSLYILKNTSIPGYILFATKIDLPFTDVPINVDGNQVDAVKLNDVDNDGKPDLIITCRNIVSIFRNISNPGSILFAAKIDFPISASSPNSLTLLRMADIDGDGKLDLLVKGTNTNLAIFRNTSTPGNIAFANYIQLDISSHGAYGFDNFSFGDYDGDGKLDISAGSFSYGFIYVAKNTSTIGNISFTQNVSYAVTDFISNYGPYDNTSADLDGDGKTDLVVVKKNNLAFLRNTPIPYLSSTTIASNNNIPSKAKNGDNITIRFTTSEAILTPVVTVASHTASITNTSGNNWSASYVMQPGDAEGAIPFTITFSSLGSIAGFTVTSSSDGSSVSYDNTAPVVLSIERYNPTGIISNADVVRYMVTFSEPVVGLTTNNFQFSYTTTSPSIIGLSNSSGLTTVVSVTTPPSGIIRLDFKSGATGVTDRAGNLISGIGFTSGQTYTIDKVTQAPMLTSPASGAFYINQVAITGSLPEKYLPGSLNLEFNNGSIIRNVALSNNIISPFSFTFNCFDPLSAPEVLASDTLAAGLYSVSLTYQDSLGNTAASVVNSNVHIYHMQSPEPLITGFTPALAGGGTTVSISGTNFTGATSVRFGGVAAASFSVISANQITAVVPANCLSGVVSVTTPDGTGTLTGFSFDSPLPNVTSVYPSTGTAGTIVSIGGSNLYGANNIYIGSCVATSFTVVSSSQVLATVGPGSTGGIDLSTPGGRAMLLEAFRYTPVPALAPIITSFSPMSATSGDSIIINGMNFSGSIFLRIGGSNCYFSVQSSTRIGGIVGDFNVSGGNSSPQDVVITNANGTGTLGGFVFRVPLVPVISGITPAAAGLYDTVVITGSNFRDIKRVNLANLEADIVTLSDSQIVCVIGPEYTGGGTLHPVNVTSYFNSASSDGFTYLSVSPTAPVVTGFSPASAAKGSHITIYGRYLRNISAVSTGTWPVASYAVTSDSTIDAVVGDGGTGSVVVGNNKGNSTKPGFTFLTPPTILGFSPGTGLSGIRVVITGTNFTGATSVRFGGVDALSFTVVSPNQINAVVGTGTSGNISVTTANGTASKAGFRIAGTFLPTITSFSPTSAAGGSEVKITGNFFNNITGVSFGDVPASSFRIDSATGITAVVNWRGTSGTVAVIGTGGTAALTGFSFILPPPVITSFTPSTAKTGDSIIVTGQNLGIVSSLLLGGTSAASFTVLSPTAVKAVVGAGATGSLSVTTPGGSIAIPGFVYIPVPTITSFSPASGASGTIITIKGTNFSAITGVSFGGTAAASFNILSSTTIVAVVAVGSSGSVSVINVNGTGTLGGFSYIAPPIPIPVIASFSPVSATSGTMVIIKGANFTGTTDVRFGNIKARSFTVDSASQIRAVVDSGSSGSIYVITPNGTASLVGFSYILSGSPVIPVIPLTPTIPSITSFAPTSAISGTTITIKGSNFTGATAVRFGDINARSFIIDSATQIRAVVDTGSSGSVHVITPIGSAILSGFTYVTASAPITPITPVTVTPSTATTITSFSPVAATTGTTVIIKGSNFTSVTNVHFGDVGATSFTVDSASQIKAIVGTGSSGSVYVTASGGTVSLSGFNFIPAPPTLSANEPVSLCEGQTATLTSSNAAYDNQWYKDGILIPGIKSNIYKVSAAGRYTVTAGNNGFVSALSQSVTVTVTPAPTIAKPKLTGYSKDTLVCFTDALNLSVDGSYDKYLWSTGETTATISVKNAGHISVKVGTNTATCYSVDSSIVIDARKNNTPVPLITRTADDLTSSASPNYQWLLNNKIIPGATSIKWSIASKGVYIVNTSTDNVCWTPSSEYIVAFDPAVVARKSFDLKLYPNPASGAFNVQVKFDRSTSAIINITLVSQAGVLKYDSKKILFSGTTIKIPITVALTSGVYTLKVDVNGEVNTQQLVIL